MAKAKDQQFVDDAHKLKENIGTQLAAFVSKYPDMAVQLNFNSEAEKPGVNMHIRQRETRSYHVAGGNTIPLKNAAPPAAAAKASE